LKEIRISIESHSLPAANGWFRPDAISSRHPLLWGWVCCGWVRLAATLAVLAVVGVPAALGQAATTTTLALSSSSVATGTVVTFTATVRNPSLVSKGTVTFCNASATYCEDSAIIGTAQLTSAGTAIIKRVPGIGVQSYEAVFTATTANAGSNSAASPQVLTVTGLYPTATAISASGTEASNYALTATVVGTGSVAFSPTSTVWFYDTSDSDAVDGTKTLGASTLAQSFGSPIVTATNGGSLRCSVAVGDFNGDGLLDVAVTNFSAGTVSVFPGAGNGSFGTPVILTAGSSPYWVVAGDFNGDGKLDLAVSNLDSNDVSVFLGNGDGTFQLQATFDVGSNPMGLAVGDFNRDGNLDLAVANSSGNSVSILLGNGLGGFATQVPYGVGDKPTSVAVADFNGDGFPDLAVTNYNDSTVSVLLGTSTGTFPTQVPYGVGTLPDGVVAGDFTGDGKPDLAVVNLISSVSVLLNTGSGAFADQVTYPWGGFDDARAIVAGDFNGDGNLDLAVADGYGGYTSILLGSGTGTFLPETEYWTGGGPTGLVVGDFNGDGNPDLAVSNNNQTLGVLLDTITQTATAKLSAFNITPGGTPQLILAYYGGNTHFSSSTSSTIPTPTSTTLQLSAPSTAVSGLPTVLTAQLSPSTNQSLTPTGTVTFYSGATSLGTGTMQSSGQASLSVSNLSAGTDSLTAAYGGDTNFLPATSPAVSIVVAKGTLTIVWPPPVAIVFGTALSATQLNATTIPALPGTFVYTPAAGYAPPVGALALSVTFNPTDSSDYNSITATVDLVVTGSATATLSLSSASVNLGTVVTLTAAATSGGAPVTAGTVTFCNALATYCDNAAVIGKAQFTATGTAIIKLRRGLGPHSYKAVFSGTTANPPSTSSAQTVTVTGVYTTSTFISASGSPGNYALAGTVTGPGNFTLPPTGTVSFLDTTTGNYLLGQAALANPNSSQSFNLSSTPSPESFPNPAVGDFNGDGIPDLAVANEGSSDITIFLGLGDGTFPTSQDYAVGNNPISIAVGDFNGDGFLDLAVANSGDNTVTILLGSVSGTFSQAPGSPYAVGSDPSWVALGDFNRDGNLDIVVANSGSNTISVLLGNGHGGFAVQSNAPATDSGPGQVLVGDFNGDGIADLVTVNVGCTSQSILQSGNYCSPNSSDVGLLLGNGDGIFQAQTTIGWDSNLVALAVGDFNNDGYLDVMALNNGNGNNYNYGSGWVDVFLNNGTGSSFTSSSFGVGDPSDWWSTDATTLALAVGDFNGNGNLDAVVTDTWDMQIEVFQGNGTGGFGGQTDYNLSDGPNYDLYSVGSFAVGDFNGDGTLDLAVGLSDPVLLNIFLGTVTETATAMQNVVLPPGSGVNHAVDASYAGATYYGSSLSSTTPLTSGLVVTTLLLAAAPTPSSFGQKVVLTATLSPTPVEGASTNGESIAFYNGATSLGPGTLTSGVATLSVTTLPVGLNSLTAAFTQDSNFLASTSPVVTQAVTPGAAPPAADVTTLALSSASSPVSSVAVGTVVTLTATVSNGATNGTVTFCNALATYCDNSALIGTAQVTAAGTAVIKIIPGIGVYSYQAVFSGTPSNAGSTSAAQALTVTGLYTTTTAISSSGTVGDYKLTGTVVGTGSASLSPSGSVSFLDTTNANYTVATATLGASIFAQTFAAASPLTAPFNSPGIAVGDFNGDGYPDLAVTDNNTGKVTIYLGGALGAFTAQTPTYATGSDPYQIVVGDFNGDGKLDLAVANSSSNNVTLLLGNGNGTFTAAVNSPFAVGSQPFSLAVGDFNGDGNLDLATANSGDGTLSILLGTGGGSFATQTVVSLTTSPTFVAAADFDGDGVLDLAIVNASGTVGVLMGNGDGSFQTQVQYAVGLVPETVAIGDLRGSGVLDLAVTNSGSSPGTVSVLLGVGDGTFGAQTAFTVGDDPQSVVVADFNGDGIPDLAVANFADSTISVLPGLGAGAFGTQVTYPTGATPYSLATGDFNQDGNLDLAVTNQYNSTVGILLNVMTQTATAATSSAVLIPGTGSTHQVKANYAGSPTYPNFSGSVSGTTPLTSSPVPLVTTSISISAVSPTSSTYGSPVALTATLTPYQQGSDTTNGESVTFYNGATNLGPATLVSGVATLSNLTTLVAGSDSLTVVYSTDAIFASSTSTPAVSFVVSKATPTVTWTTPAAITFGTTLSSTQLNATASTPGTFVYTPLLGTTPATGTDTLSVTFTPTDTTDYNTPAAATVSLTVNKATPTITWATPTAITFGTTLSSTQLNATASTPGTFVYSGDSLYPSTTTNPVKLSTSATPDFAVASSTLTQTVTAGQSATYTINVTPSNGFASKVTFTASGMPTGATAVFAPSSVTPNGAAVSSTLTIATAASTAAMHLPGLGHGTGFLAMSILSLPLMGIAWLGGSWLGGSWLGGKRLGRQRSHRSHVLRLVFLATLSLGMVFNMAACGGGTGTSGSSSTPKTYTITITATSASLTHSTAVTLIVN
jgi:hypothetical protein